MSARREQVVFAAGAAVCASLVYSCENTVGTGPITGLPDGGTHMGPHVQEPDGGSDADGLESSVEEASDQDAGPLNDATSPQPDVATSSSPDTGGTTEASTECPAKASRALATKITFTVGWPSTMVSNTGTGTVNLLFLTTFAGGALTGSRHFCGMRLPDLVLNSTAMAGSKVLVEVPNATWDKLARTFSATATQVGANVGDLLQVVESVDLLGLAQTSAYASAATSWPPACTTNMCLPSGSFATSDLQDDDNDGHPAITALPLTTSGYVRPPTGAVSAPLANQVFEVYRTEIGLDERLTDCVHSSGTATVSLFDSHVVGCMTVCSSSPSCTTGSTPQACSSAQVQFLDENRAIYGYDQTAGDVPSPSHPIVGTAATILLPAGADCADARAAFSPTFD